jgi:two-component system response regulator AtoC
MGLSVQGLSEQALDTLKEYSFPGNVRELENVLERAVIFAEGSELRAEDLELRGVVLHEGEQKQSVQPVSASGYVNEKTGEPLMLKEIETRAIIMALHRWEGNRTHAAKELGISRRTLINKIAENGLEI